MLNDKNSKFVYEKVIENISKQITKGILKEGEKLPSIRKLSQDLHVSKNTVIQAYVHLEAEGIIESKMQSGFYVRKRTLKSLPEVETVSTEVKLSTFNKEDLIANAHEIATLPKLISFGGGVPSIDMLPEKQVNRIISKILKSDEETLQYKFPPGYYKLRREISKICNEWGGDISPDDVIVTSGAAEAISLTLKAITEPGGVVITESPTFYLIPQILKSLGLKCLEISTHPKYGIEPDELKKAVSSYKASACILYPTVNSPLGSIMPDDRRKAVYNILASKSIPIIECDVWGELHFLSKRPKPLKSIDDRDLVIFLTSLTKTGVPGLRVGWVCPPKKYFKRIKELKYAHTIATSSISQIAATEYIKSGTYFRSIKHLRQIYKSRIKTLSELVSEHFPDGTQITKPEGGPFLWIRFPGNIDTEKLQELSIKHRITFNPGTLFSSTNKFDNFIRLSCACRWDFNEISFAIKKIAELAKFLYC